jgi:glycosyltransferase involved in cell wall biosynthesis
VVNERDTKKLNIGIVTTWFDRGAAYVSKAYIQALSQRHCIFVYARGGERYARGEEGWDTPYVTWGKRIRLGINTFIAWQDFYRWVDKNHLDMIIFNEQQSWDIILRSMRLDVLIGAYIDYYTPQTIPFFHLYDFLLCNTRRHLSVFKDHPQALYIPWGTDCSTFMGNTTPVSESGVVFFQSCGLNPYRKGTDLLVKAFQEVQGNARLILHSQTPLADPQMSEVIDRDPRIQVIVDTVGPPGLYHLGDVYVYPARLDGIGLTIAEALASGLPVITVDNGPMNEFIADGVNGRLVPVETYQRRSDGYYWDEGICELEALTRAIQYYVDHRDQLPEFKRRARAYAEANLDWSKQSAFLPDQILAIKPHKKPPALIRSAAWFEYHRYPSLMFAALKRRIWK